MIHDAVTQLREVAVRSELPWLILGKGPTLAKLTPELAAAHNLLVLNHAIDVVPRPYKSPTIVHFTDIEALADCVVTLSRGHPRVIMPWHPHVHMEPAAQTIVHHAEGHRAAAIAISDLLERRDVWGYNSDRALMFDSHPDLQPVRVRAFSAVPAFNLLALAGAKEIFTLGVDGGKDYDPRMDPKNKLANGHKSFDAQATELGRTIAKHSIRWVRL